MQQGAKANYTGKQFERRVQILLESTKLGMGEPPKYEAAWGTGKKRNQTDKWLKDKDIQIELKWQAVSGTCDLKPFAELWNANQKINCVQYILVLGGPHWDTERGNNIYKEAKIMADVLNAGAARSGAKKLSVMKFSEFKEWIHEQS